MDTFGYVVLALAAGAASPRAETIDALARHLTRSGTVVLVDNFEHLLVAAGQLATLLERAPNLRLLVTSQARLRLREEQVVELQPLALPADDHRDLEQLAAAADAAHAAGRRLVGARRVDCSRYRTGSRSGHNATSAATPTTTRVGHA